MQNIKHQAVFYVEYLRQRAVAQNGERPQITFASDYCRVRIEFQLHEYSKYNLKLCLFATYIEMYAKRTNLM